MSVFARACRHGSRAIAVSDPTSSPAFCGYAHQFNRAKYIHSPRAVDPHGERGERPHRQPRLLWDHTRSGCITPREISITPVAGELRPLPVNITPAAGELLPASANGAPRGSRPFKEIGEARTRRRSGWLARLAQRWFDGRVPREARCPDGSI
eukprot:1192701-Prorocentrum_minimum.AAC.1